jgi:hypothetical protein
VAFQKNVTIERVFNNHPKMVIENSAGRNGVTVIVESWQKNE